MNDEQNLRKLLELARGEINRQQPLRALEYLGTIFRSMDKSGMSKNAYLWAEYKLTYAEALAAMCDEGAGAAFQDALDCVQSLPDQAPTLEMRCHEHYGKYLVSNGRRFDGLDHYQEAKQRAIHWGVGEDRARIGNKITRVMLKTDEDPRILAFQDLREVAKGEGASEERIAAAWAVYWGESEAQRPSLRAARNYKSLGKDYFRDLLSSVKEDEDEILS